MSRFVWMVLQCDPREQQDRCEDCFGMGQEQEQEPEPERNSFPQKTHGWSSSHCSIHFVCTGCTVRTHCRDVIE